MTSISGARSKTQRAAAVADARTTCMGDLAPARRPAFGTSPPTVEREGAYNRLKGTSTDLRNWNSPWLRNPLLDAL